MASCNIKKRARTLREATTDAFKGHGQHNFARLEGSLSKKKNNFFKPHWPPVISLEESKRRRRFRERLERNGGFPLHCKARYNSVQLTFGGFSTGQYLVPGTFFSTTSAEVPSEPYHYQNMTCKLCWSLIGQRKSSLPASLNLRHETQQTR